ncbi:MAG: hypothetical protein WCR91_03295 [Sphaerochaetaceae bacterium]
MIHLEHERYSMIRLFEACVSSLALLVELDKLLFSWRRPRIAICHRLAHYLEQTIFGQIHPSKPDEYVFDLSAPVGGPEFRTVNPDILLHNRDTDHPIRPMAIICRDDYLSEQELNLLQLLKTKAQCTLSLAIAFLPQKPYLLIYRADDEWIDYYHFERENSHCHLLRRRDMGELIDDGNQLKLGIKRR